MAPKCEPLCHFGDRHVLPLESVSTSTQHPFSSGSTLQPFHIHLPVHTSSITNLLTQTTIPAYARDPGEAHPHLPTMTPPTTTSRSTTSCSISLSSRTGAHSISQWSTRLASLSTNYSKCVYPPVHQHHRPDPFMIGQGPPITSPCFVFFR